MSERERYWRGVLEQWRASEMSRAAFCRRQGINYHTLSQWKSRIEADRGGRSKRNGNAQARRPRFVEVTVPTASAPAAAYEITLAGGRSLKVPPGFDESDVARLIAVAESC
jgi:transposase-like protein